jgi:hypothetical protein
MAVANSRHAREDQEFIDAVFADTRLFSIGELHAGR